MVQIQRESLRKDDSEFIVMEFTKNFLEDLQRLHGLDNSRIAKKNCSQQNLLNTMLFRRQSSINCMLNYRTTNKVQT